VAETRLSINDVYAGYQTFMEAVSSLLQQLGRTAGTGSGGCVPVGSGEPGAVLLRNTEGNGSATALPKFDRVTAPNLTMRYNEYRSHISMDAAHLQPTCHGCPGRRLTQTCLANGC